jgi:hypothetical protein
MPSIELIQAVAVTAELCGRTFSEGAARMFVQDLAGFPEQAVIKALARCRREVKGMLTIQDVITRIDDGRPGAEEAWAQMPFDESQSVVWTDEMCRAFGVARGLLEEGDKVAARMAFKEAYTRMVGESRDLGRPVVWTPSLGYDKNGHAAELSEAVSLGRLSYEHAESICFGLPRPSATITHLEAPKTFAQLAGMAAKRGELAA